MQKLYLNRHLHPYRQHEHHGHHLRVEISTAVQLGLLLRYFHTRQLCIKIRSRNYIKITIPIHISNKNSLGSKCIVCNICSCPTRVCCSLFSYQAIVLSSLMQKLYLNHHLHPYRDMNIFRSISIVAITDLVNVGSAAPLFSYQQLYRLLLMQKLYLNLHPRLNQLHKHFQLHLHW